MMPPDVATGVLVFVGLTVLRFGVPLLVVIGLGAAVRRIEVALPT